MRVTLQLQCPGIQIREAGSRKEALAAVKSFRPTLVFLDVNLPDGNGLDLLRQLRTWNRSARVLMVAAEVDPWTVREALAAGAAGFVGKATSADRLAGVLQGILYDEVFLCPEAQAALRRAESTGFSEAETLPPAVLTSRERQVLRYLAHGENTKSIAGLMELSPKTVETYRSRLMRKLGTNSVAVLTRYAIRHELTPL
jgi:DNA-binding NarL/FixJ family response regulator